MKKSIHLLFFVCLFSVFSCEKVTEPSTNTGWRAIYQAADSVTYNDIFFVDKNNGWIIGNHATILYSVDGGINWEKQDGPGRSYIGLNSVCFSDKQHGWIVGDDFEMYYTTNGGSTWNYNLPVLPIFTWNFTSVFFANNQNGWITTSLGRVEFTTNGGILWDGGAVVADHDRLSDIYFVDNMTGWIIAENHKVFNTDNGGSTWFEQKVNNKSADSLSRFNDIIFTDSMNGWIITGSSEIFHTSNGGTEWFFQSKVQDSNLNAVYFGDEKAGWIAGNNIYFTGDGGNSWKLQYNNLNNEFIGMSFVNKTGWALSAGGKVCKYE